MHARYPHETVLISWGDVYLKGVILNDSVVVYLDDEFRLLTSNKW